MRTDPIAVLRRLRIEVERPNSLNCNQVKLMRALCDEAFCVLDVQLDHPAIRVGSASAGEILIEIGFVFSILLSGASEGAGAVTLRHTLPEHCIHAIMCG